MLQKELLGFFAGTFYGHQYHSLERLESILDKVLEDLEAWGFAEKVKEIVRSTRLGKRVAEMYIDPLTAHEFIGSLGKKKNKFSYLVQLSLASEMRPLARVRKKEEDAVFIALQKHEEWLETPEDGYELEEYLSAVKNSMILEEWLEEKTEDRILEEYNMAPGILKRKIDAAEWLLYAFGEIARIMKRAETHAETKRLRTRMRYGVKEELLPLVRFKGIGRVKARRLMKEGIKGVKEIRSAELDKLAYIIGDLTAKKLKEQAVGEKK